MLRHDRGDESIASPDTGTSPTSPSQPSSKKRKSTSQASRGVASLTPEQLAKKRANDREAQRAIRERTKNQIEALEQRITELTAQQPYQELQAVIRQKEAIQAENDEIRRRLASILSIIQPVVGAQGLTDLATAAHDNLHFHTGQHAAPFGGAPFVPEQAGLTEARPYLESDPSGAGLSTIPHDGAYVPQYGGDGRDATNARLWQSSMEALSHQRSNIQRGLELNASGERLSFNFLLDSALQPQKTRQSPNHHPSPPQLAVRSHLTGSPYLGHGQASWMTLPKNIAPTCPLDSILLKFLEARQQEVQNGASQSSIAGPAYPSVASLLNAASHPPADKISQIMTDIITKFPGICGLPEQVAVVFLMFLHMRWQVHPTQDNYERLPDWLTPRPSQLFEPHPAWIDHLPWPKMRDRLVRDYRNYPFETWFIPFTGGLSINWPYEASDVLLSTSEKEEPIINPVFERHVLRLENWSVGPQFVAAFPALADVCRVRARGE